jgi:predicted nucleic acid-binding protein
VILADTSAWVEFDRATGSPIDRRMLELVDDGRLLAVTEPVVMEVLAGAKDDDREQLLRRLLGRFALLRFDPASDFDAAARTYRRCWAGGVTPRGLIDCMITAVAWRHSASLLTGDADLVRAARVMGVEVDEASWS